MLCFISQLTGRQVQTHVFSFTSGTKERDLSALHRGRLNSHMLSYVAFSCQVFASRDNGAAAAPHGPPKPPRSAFICFSDAKKKEIMARHSMGQTKDILKLVADEWRALSTRERAFWDEESRNDKLRYSREKEAYKGPWNIPKRRAKKDPAAPKRPMSAFLKFSKNQRAIVKEKNPDMSNTDVSRLLGEMWRNSRASEKSPYEEEELRERHKYKEEMKRWREQKAKFDAASRTSHQTVKHIGEKQSRIDRGASVEEHGEPYSMFEPLAVGETLPISDQSVFRTYRNPIGDATNRHPARRSNYLESDPSKDEPRPARRYPVPSSHLETRAAQAHRMPIYYAHPHQHQPYGQQPYQPGTCA